MVIIFIFSAQEAHESSGLSERFIKNITPLFVRDFQYMQETEQMLLIDSLQHIVRKGAHMFVYFVLGALVLGAVFVYKLKLASQIIAAFVIVVLYAISDEIHQYFVPGRAAMIGDVIIDAAGGAAGMIFHAAIRKVLVIPPFSSCKSVR